MIDAEGRPIESVQDMAQAALASGTHRVEIFQGFGDYYRARLVERENPDPDVLFMREGKKEGPFVICPTPFRTEEGQEIEVILVQDASSPVGFNIMVNTPEGGGGPKYTPFDPRK